MIPHQQRAVEEKAELLKKTLALNDFIGVNPIFMTLPADEQERMKIQLDIMWQYVEILASRINAFPKDTK